MAKKFLWRPISITPTKAGKKTKIHIPQPEFKALQLNKRDVVKWEDINLEMDWFTLHKRGPRRAKVGEDPLEARAVPHGYIKGTLPERIVYYYLTKYMKFQSGVDFDFQCVGAKQRVLTKDFKWVEAGSLKIGDKLLAFSEDLEDVGGKVKRSRYYKEATVTHASVESLPAMEVELSDGTKIVTTEEHPWLAFADLRNPEIVTFGHSMNWVTTNRLRVGMEIPRFMTTWEEDTSKQAGYIAGFFDGEGSVVHHKTQTGGHALSLTVGQNAGEMFDMFNMMVEDCGFDFSVYDYRGKYKRSYDNGKREVIQMRIAGGRSEIFRFLGTIRPAKLQRIKIEKLGRLSKRDVVKVVSIRQVKQQPIARLSTSTKTYFCEGFGMHNSSLEGGRMQLGGLVVDFLFPYMRIIIQVQGPTHDTFLRKAKDNQQIDDLAKMGFTVYELEDSVIYDEFLLEEWMRRTFSLPAGVGGSGGAHGAREGDLTDVEIVYQRVLALQQSLISYFGA